jgi:hypothetical protein
MAAAQAGGKPGAPPRPRQQSRAGQRAPRCPAAGSRDPRRWTRRRTAGRSRTCRQTRGSPRLRQGRGAWARRRGLCQPIPAAAAAAGVPAEQQRSSRSAAAARAGAGAGGLQGRRPPTEVMHQHLVLVVLLVGGRHPGEELDVVAAVELGQLARVRLARALRGGVGWGGWGAWGARGRREGGGGRGRAAGLWAGRPCLPGRRAPQRAALRRGAHVDLHLLVQPVADDQVVRHGEAVRLHRVVLPEVEGGEVRVVEVRHLLLSRHGCCAAASSAP